MILEYFLLFCFAFLFYYAHRQRKKTLVGFIIISILSIFGIFATIFRDSLTEIANFLGIGRGVDLVFYLFLIIATALFFRYYIWMQQMDIKLTKLARLHAIRDKNQRNDLDQ